MILSGLWQSMDCGSHKWEERIYIWIRQISNISNVIRQVHIPAYIVWHDFIFRWSWSKDDNLWVVIFYYYGDFPTCRHGLITKESNIPHPLKHEFEHNCNFHWMCQFCNLNSLKENSVVDMHIFVINQLMSISSILYTHPKWKWNLFLT